MFSLALYQPDMAPNVGAAIRLCACTGTGLDVIEPCGFPWGDRKIKRSAMDYIDHIDIRRHASWQDFLGRYQGQRRIILLSTKAEQIYTDFRFSAGDILLMGQESAGVPEDVHNQADIRLIIPMAPPCRSLNIVNAAAMVIGEAARQLRNAERGADK